jgi:hypothetical protein
MLRDIGLMIGLYILTRCASFLTRTGERRESVTVILLAVATIIGTLFALADLWIRGSQTAPLSVTP